MIVHQQEFLARLAIFAAVMAASISSGSTVLGQASTASAAGSNGPLPSYVLNSRNFFESRKKRGDREEFGCCGNDEECLKLSRAPERSPLADWPFSFTKPASDIREIDLDGLKKLLQRDPKDTRPLLVNFWATWCDGCREEFPDLVKIDNDYRAKGLNFLSVTLDEVADKSKAVDFLKEMKATMPVVLLNVNDPEPAIHAVDEKWDGALPATFLYDRDGTIVFRYYGKIKPAELRAAIDKEVGSKQ